MMSLVSIFLLLWLTSARNFYVDSAKGKDTNTGTSTTSPWRTTAKVTSFASSSTNGFRPGDTIYLNGAFTSSITSSLATSYGTRAQPLRFTSLNPATPATITVAANHGIYFWDYGAGTGNSLQSLGLQIDNLIITGNGALRSDGKTTGGIYIYHDFAGNLDGLLVFNVRVSGFTEAGLITYRSKYSTTQTGFITNVNVYDSVFFNNPGKSGIMRPVGSGLVLAGVNGATVARCEAYGNGRLNNNNPGGGPVGIWAYDSNNVTFVNCSSHDNLSTNHDGGGYDFDGGSTNCQAINCVSKNNWGPGFEVCAYSDTNINNLGKAANITFTNCSSSGDGYGKGFASFGVFSSGQSITNVTIASSRFVITNYTTCTFWSSSYTTHNGIWLYQAAGVVFTNVKTVGTTFACAAGSPVNYTQNVNCNSSPTFGCQ